MTSRSAILTLSVAALLLAAAAPAEARRGGSSRRARARAALVEAPDSPVTAREMRIRLERRGLSDQEMRVDLERATPGFELDLYLADATGALVQVGDLRERRAGHYRFRVRTRKGDALPFGVTDLADLGGRAAEVRTADGALVAEGTVPSLAAAAADGSGGSSGSGSSGSGSGGGSDDGPNHDVGDDHGGGDDDGPNHDAGDDHGGDR